MSIHHRDTKNGPRHEVRWREGDRNRSRTFRSEDEAAEFQAAINRRHRLGAFAPTEPSPTPLDDFLEHWVRTSGVEWAPTTLRTRSHLLDKWVSPYLGHVPLRDIGRMRVKEFRAEIVRAGSRPTNTNNVMRVLSAALGVAEDEGLIPVNPCLRMGKVRQDPTNRVALPEETLLRLIDLAPTPRDAAIVALSGLAALRPAEVIGLMWGDTAGDSLHVWASVQGGERGPVKNGKPRTIPIEPALNLALAQARGDLVPVASDLVAPGHRGGYLNFAMWGRRVWRPLREAAGIGEVPFYSLRHSAISRWIAQGHDLMTVSTWAGHHASITLKVYAHQIAQAQKPTGQSDPEAA